ncbi:Hsp20/alpha crystallin family protein [Halovibrio sp. HP20-50]|uniref:Hsp20/alpha crystallin family protein n=1 Tax=Halovibrio sp. HP20-59 TaxID=3080275 RepID=UPI00294B0669|nr:Hsp20/alpha crystallin family protein [Halovibrio sp. HP20-59]MEA2118383.1 Hsp20/alpha crystallin family protein [Halovibrio sp. HP20-59]
MARLPSVRDYEPSSLLRQFSSEIERLFDQDRPGISPLSGQWTPAVDIREESDEYRVEAEVPGIDPKDLEVTLENNVLTLRGQRQEENEEESNGLRHVERSYGAFVRRFTLPEAASDEEVEARADKGVLKLRIKKKEQSGQRRIEVQG